MEPGTQTGGHRRSWDPGTQVTVGGATLEGVGGVGCAVVGQRGSCEPGTHTKVEVGGTGRGHRGSVEHGTQTGGQRESWDPGTQTGGQRGSWDPGTQMGGGGRCTIGPEGGCTGTGPGVGTG